MHKTKLSKGLIATLLLSLAFNVIADERIELEPCKTLPNTQNPGKTTIGLHLFSTHSASGFNNQNQGIYLEFENHITLGHYYNSIYRESNYAGYTYSLTNHIDLTLALFTGYSLYKYAPLLVPTYKVSNIYEDYSLRVALIPKVPKVIDANVLHAMIEKSF